MFCPQCKAEYRPGFTECSDCNVALVERWSRPVDAEDNEDDQPEVVFRAADIVEANLVRSLLEASGIEVYISDESHIVPVDGIVLAVPRTQEGSALDILRDYPANTDVPMGTLSQIEAEVDALPLAEQEDLLRHLTDRLRESKSQAASAPTQNTSKSSPDDDARKT